MGVFGITRNSKWIFFQYGLNELKLRFRTRLSNHLYEQYLRTFTYYKMSNLDNRISNADQLLTQDVVKFCDSVGELYSNLSKVGSFMAVRIACCMDIDRRLYTSMYGCWNLEGHVQWPFSMSLVS